MTDHAVETRPGVPHALHEAVETLVSEFTKHAEAAGGAGGAGAATGGGTAPAVLRPDTVLRAGDADSTAITGGGALDISLTIGAQVFELKLALPDQTPNTPLWGCQVTQQSNTVILVLVQNSENWRVEVGAPMLPHTFNFGANESLTINTLGFQVVKGSPPASFTFS